MERSLHSPLFRFTSRTYFALLVLATLVASSFFVWSSNGAQGSISLQPPSTSINLYPGDSGTYQLKVHNGMTSLVTVRLTVFVSTVPTYGSARDITLRYPSSLIIASGNTLVTV